MDGFLEMGKLLDMACVFIFLGKSFNFPEILRSLKIAAKRSNIQTCGKESAGRMKPFVSSRQPCFGSVEVGLNLPVHHQIFLC